MTDEAWRLIHLVGAAFWLGGLILLAVVAAVAARTLDSATFRLFMSRSGQHFAAGSMVAGLLVAGSGAAMAWPRLHHSLAALQTTGFGRLLGVKTTLAIVVAGLTVAHSVAGRRGGSLRAIALSRAISALILLLTLVIFWLAVRMTEE